MIVYSSIEVERIVKGFQTQTLPDKEWTHNAHLLVSVWYCQRYSPEETLEILREKIKIYNESVGGENTDTAGYHESITRFWIWQTNVFLKTDTFLNKIHASNQFIQSNLSDKNRLLEFYSKSLLFSTEARRNWVPPDLKKME